MRTPHEIVFYTRVGCHLCVEALGLITEEGRKRPLTLRVVDVDDDPELARKYGSEVPVVYIDGRKRFFGAVDPVLLRRVLRAPAPKKGG